MEKTLGGDRLGSGKKMQVHLHNYQRSTHNLSYIWRSTNSSGTLIPFLNEIALPGDTFDIDLECIVKTHPTIGPLFGSYKVQLDVFSVPLRLYIGQLHNNKLNVGRDMSQVFLPQIRLWAEQLDYDAPGFDIDNAQINPSCILAYLGIRGIGSVKFTPPAVPTTIPRLFNAIDLLAYWDIYKNYYANKQEGIGAVIHTPTTQIVDTITSMQVLYGGSPNLLEQFPTTGVTPVEVGSQVIVNYTGAAPQADQIQINVAGSGGGGNYALTLSSGSFYFIEDTGTALYFGINSTFAATEPTFINWSYRAQGAETLKPIGISTFLLENIDQMREALLSFFGPGSYKINDLDATPYSYIAPASQTSVGDVLSITQSQEGLALKTYQSDLFNNWLSTEWITGIDGISEVTAIDTTSGSFTIDTFIVAKKVYNMLNRIAVSGGSYNDWLDAVYMHPRFTAIESPVYCGGLSKELVFQEVISNAASIAEGSTEQPLGTLAGRGVMSSKHKGGKIYIKIDEPSIIMGIYSLTPRIDYSQGNKWHVNISNMNGWHKPALDGIGFQDLIMEQMAWWSTNYNSAAPIWAPQSAGKQPAWIHYQTNVNRTYGNFAIKTNEMFMTLNRRYEADTVATPTIADLTTYVDPEKFNWIFAQTAIDSQNFWTQIGVNMIARRKMSANIMPNL